MKTENPATSTDSIPNPTRQLGAEQLKSAKIFLIDDEPIILELFEVFLRNAGFQEIFPFTDSVEAVETLRYLTPSIILTDINMPEVSGNFLIKLIRTYEHLRTVPIIAITSNASREGVETTIRKGADAVINKPVDEKTLTEKVTQILQSTLRLKQQISDAEEREQQLIEKKKAQMISVESNLRDMMR